MCSLNLVKGCCLWPPRVPPDSGCAAGRAIAGTVEDQLFLLTLNILGDGTTLLDKKDILVLVPAQGRR